MSLHRLFHSNHYLVMFKSNISENWGMVTVQGQISEKPAKNLDFNNT